MEKKKIIKLGILLGCIVMVAVATIILHLLNNSPVFAESIFAKQTVIQTNNCNDIINLYQNISIAPSNYNQGVEFKTDNTSVKIDNNGRISFLESNIVANITVFVKQNNSTKIYTTFQVEVLNGSGDYLEKNVVYIYDNETAINKLNYHESCDISVKSKHNIINYDYKTGVIAINENKSHNNIYDKITIEIKSQYDKISIISFEVIGVKKLVYDLSNGYEMINFENLNNDYDEMIDINIENDLIVSEWRHEYNLLLIYLNKIGTTKITISSTDFTYIYEISVI